MPKQLEDRVASLEAEVEWLKSQVENGAPSKPWWSEIAGVFADSSAYDEAMRLGREYRDSLRSNSVELDE